MFSATVRESPELEERIKSLFEKWLSFDGRIRILLDFFETQEYDGGVKEASEYRECVATATNILKSWKSPEASMAVGLRQVHLDKEQSKFIREMLAK